MWSEEKSKIARRCGEKHVFNQNVLLATCSDHFFEVAMWKNCTPLWREAHFEVKMQKN